MILSLFVYTFLALILWLLAKDQDVAARRLRTDKGDFFTWQNVTSIILFGVFYGIRRNVGMDNMMYIRIYEAMENGRILRDIEPGFSFIQDLFIGAGFHYSVFIGFWGALQIGLIYYAMRRDKYLLPLIALFIVLGPTFLRWANIMRQAVAECAFIVMIQAIVDRKLWKYLIGIVFCIMVHKSAIILLPFYFILQKQFFPKNKWVGVAILAGCTLVGLTPIWFKSINNIAQVLSFFHYDTYVDNIDEIMKNTDNFRAWGPARAGVWLLYLTVIWSYPQLRTRFHFEKRFDIFYTCFFWGNCAYELLANTNQIFIRPLSYFQATSVVMVPICLYYVGKCRNRILFYSFCFLAFFNTYWWTIKAYLSGGAGDDAVEVYKFFFQ